MTFFEGFEILRAARPGWDLTQKQAAVWAALLSDIPPADLVAGAMQLAGETEYPFTIAGWRKHALGSHELPCVDDAWEELRRNRALEMQLVYEQRPEVIERVRDRITWSSEASRRAAEYVCWREPNWLAADLNTIRAQHRGAYQSIVEKQGRIDAANDAMAMLPIVMRALNGKPNNLLGGGT